MRKSAAPSRVGISHSSPSKTVENVKNKFITDSVQLKHVVQSSPSDEGSEYQDVRYFEAVYGKASTKKHKTWDGDGFIVVCGRHIKLLKDDGKMLSSSPGNKIAFVNSLTEGSLVKLGAFEAELVTQITSDAYRTKMLNSLAPITTNKRNVDRGGTTSSLHKIQRAPKCPLPTVPTIIKGFTPKIRESCPPAESLIMPRPPSQCVWAQNPEGLPIVDVFLDGQLARRLRPHQKEGVIFLYECVMGFRSLPLVTESLSDLNNWTSWSDAETDAPRNNPVYGCILADEMGLGKTVQAIATLWMLSNQGPYGGRPVVRRCLIVTPSGLISNWSKEISKWIGRERMPTYHVSQSSTMKSYLEHPDSFPSTIIISYEMFLQHSEEVCAVPNLDMVICDEGHRLKNAGIHTSLALRQLPSRRRILLTGTPVQNRLDELWSLSEFCAPGRLGASQEAFRREYGNIKSSRPLEGAESDDEDLAGDRLSRILNSFLLRRTSEVIERDLTSKSEFIVFCQSSPLQSRLEAMLLGWVQRELEMDRDSSTADIALAEEDTDDENNDSSSGSTGSNQVLCAITAFRKLHNHPELLQSFLKGAEKNDDGGMRKSRRLPAPLTQKLMSVLSELNNSFPAPTESVGKVLPHNYLEASGKMAVLSHMLVNLFPCSAQNSHRLAAKRGRLLRVSVPSHRLVLVSNFTQTLDLLELLCNQITGQASLRLDGHTSAKRREEIVQQFNNPNSPDRILLLSSRAGGTGLNLIGADHLILFDMDWNPANDAQAMARIWRPGQSRPVRLYRLVTAGGIEERIFQRQAAKLALSHNTLSGSIEYFLKDRKGSNRSGILTREELRDLFQSPPSSKSWTHDLIGCTCDSEQVCSPSPSLSPSPSDDDNTKSTVCPSEQSDSELDEDVRSFQLGSSGRCCRPQSKPTGSDSLAFLLNWTHSLSPDSVNRLCDPLLTSGTKDDLLPITAVFSLKTNQWNANDSSGFDDSDQLSSFKLDLA
ncbi:unnamed protein product [Calicophoron daubneyi]|uniref:DNA repair and recombination protein RAD54B n=1 Tax=Calicophoron daubneyi TaxID=300641 RepID=A0AAV2TPA7_CALDB